VYRAYMLACHHIVRVKAIKQSGDCIASFPLLLPPLPTQPPHPSAISHRLSKILSCLIKVE
ncbi:hypothetical protein J6590_101636, partial [Homalodisca vitripennis]